MSASEVLPSWVLRRAKEIFAARQAFNIPEAIHEVTREITNRAESLFVEANEVKNIYKWRVGPKGISELSEAFDRAIALAEAEEAHQLEVPKLGSSNNREEE